MEDDVGGILGFPDAPMVTGAEVTDDGAVQTSKAIEPTVKFADGEDVGKLLSGGIVVDMHKGVIE